MPVFLVDMQLLGDFLPASDGIAGASASIVEDPGFECHHRPLSFVGPISEIVKKLPQNMQLSRVGIGSHRSKAHVQSLLMVA